MGNQPSRLQDPVVPPVNIDMRRERLTGNPLTEFTFLVGGHRYRLSPVVLVEGSEEHLNQSSQDWLVVRRVNLCTGAPSVLDESRPVQLALNRITDDTINACVTLNTIDPAIVLPALWRA